MKASLNPNSTTAVHGTNTRKGRKIGTALGAGVSASYIYATRDGMFKKMPEMILAKHQDMFMNGIKQSKVVNASANKDVIISTLKDAAKVLGKKESFEEIAKKASELVEDKVAREVFNENLNKISEGAGKLIKKDKIRCIALPIAITVGAITAGGALLGTAVGKLIDAHKQKKEVAELEQLKMAVKEKYPEGIRMLSPVSAEEMNKMMNDKAYLKELLSH